jgi:hypothetical protein
VGGKYEKRKKNRVEDVKEKGKSKHKKGKWKLQR